MKILIINLYYNFCGGAEVITKNTFDVLKKHGHEVYYWACNKSPFWDENYEYIKYFTDYNGGINNYIKNPLRYYYNNKAKKDLDIFIKLVKPDIVHIHNVYSLSNSIYDCCKYIPTVRTIHDSSLFCPAATLMNKNKQYCQNLYCKNNNFLSCIKNKCVNNSLEASIRRALFTFLQSKKNKYINKFITPSDALRDKIIEAKIGIEEKSIVTINNFLPSSELSIVPNYSNKGYFLYIGRLSSEKGVKYLLESMKDLPVDIKLKIVGIGPEESRLKKYVLDNDLYNVEFLGLKNREEIKDLYQNCIATILPCNWFENFPTTNMESFINGKSVIASNIGGIPEQVVDNKTGLLFQPANVKQLKECILKYWNNLDLAVEHGKNCYQKAITQYTEDRYYHELIKVYEEVM